MSRLIGKLAPIFAVLAVISASDVGAETTGVQKRISTTAKDFEIFLASLPPNNVLKSAYTQLGKQRIEPVFVFIPGILGSKLILEKENKEEEIVWGCLKNVLKFSDNLSYDVAPKLTAKPLLGPDSPRDDCAFELYKKFFNAMTYSGPATENTFLNFAYDWRQGNDQSAKALDAFIRSHARDLKRRKVVFIAHSMGGLVFKWWYFHHYAPATTDYDFDIEMIYFVGTPHSGSFAAVHALKDGYTLFAKAGTFLGWMEHKIEPALNKHGLTFPSFYQLLPFESDDQFKSSFQPSSGRSGRKSRIDLMMVNAWRWLGLPNTSNITLPPHVTGEQFYESRLGKLLDAARKFHEDLSARPAIKPARYVYSFIHETPNGLVARESSGSMLSMEIIMDSKSGDGTVFVESASDAAKGISTYSKILLNKKHADLIVDENFIEMMFDLRANLVNNWEDAAREWQKNEAVISLLAENDVLLPTAGADMAWLRPKKIDVICANLDILTAQFCERSMAVAYRKESKVVEISENKTLDAIGFFNAMVLGKMAKIRGISVGALSAELYASAKVEKHPLVRKERYLSYIGVEKFLLPDDEGNVANYAWAHNNLGSLMLQQGAIKTASFPLKNAYEIAKGMNIGSLITKSSKNLDAAVVWER